MKCIPSLSSRFSSLWHCYRRETTSEEADMVHVAFLFLLFMAVLSALFIASNHGELC
jgi:hypothetical protein